MEKNINRVVQMIDLGLEVDEIHDTLIETGVTEEDAYLIYKAAQLLSTYHAIDAS